MALPAAIGFDFGDTLCEYAGVSLNWEREYGSALSAVARSCRCELTPDRLRAGHALLLRYNTRVTPRLEDREYTADHIFGELLAEWNQPGEQLAPAVAAFFSHFRQNLREVPGASELLRVLGRLGVPVGVLTDVPYGMPHSFVVADLVGCALSVPPTRLLTSVIVGRRKPHPAGFATLAATLGVVPSELVYVGNEEKDMLGGNAAGCRTILFWRNGEPPTWGQHFTIRSLGELVELFDERW